MDTCAYRHLRTHTQLPFTRLPSPAPSPAPARAQTLIYTYESKCVCCCGTGFIKNHASGHHGNGHHANGRHACLAACLVCHGLGEAVGGLGV